VESSFLSPLDSEASIITAKSSYEFRVLAIDRYGRLKNDGGDEFSVTLQRDGGERKL
jgi:hypothetical protein